MMWMLFGDEPICCWVCVFHCFPLQVMASLALVLLYQEAVS